jgi:hypothetical protein
MMNALLDTRTAERLAKICGMFGSDHEGERASAAALADKFLRDLGLTWRDIISRQRNSDLELLSIDEKIRVALANLDALSMWERGFIYTVHGKCCLSREQLELLNRLVDKVRSYRATGACPC